MITDDVTKQTTMYVVVVSLDRTPGPPIKNSFRRTWL